MIRKFKSPPIVHEVFEWDGTRDSLELIKSLYVDYDKKSHISREFFVIEDLDKILIIKVAYDSDLKSRYEIHSIGDFFTQDKGGYTSTIRVEGMEEIKSDEEVKRKGFGIWK